MLQKDKLFFLFLITIALVAIVTIMIDRSMGGYRPGLSKQSDKAVYYAKNVYQAKKDLGEDLSDGLCLTNDLLPDWVADIVHNPRQKIDDLPQNQCQAFIIGRAKHFVELDLEGNVIRVK